MEKSLETKSAETKGSWGLAGFILWPLLLVLLYILSTGPVMLLEKKRAHGGPFVEKFYAPVSWLYEKTFLHKPLGLYFHLWAPGRYDQNGDWMLLDIF